MNVNLQLSRNLDYAADIFTIIPTCLVPLSPQDLRSAMCVSRSFRWIVKESIIYNNLVAIDLFKNFFKENQYFSFFNLNNSKWSEKRSLFPIQNQGILLRNDATNNLSIKLNKSQLDQLKQLFLGKRLPLGAENLLERIADKRFANAIDKVDEAVRSVIFSVNTLIGGLEQANAVALADAIVHNEEDPNEVIDAAIFEGIFDQPIEGNGFNETEARAALDAANIVLEQAIANARIIGEEVEEDPISSSRKKVLNALISLGRIANLSLLEGMNPLEYAERHANESYDEAKRMLKDLESLRELQDTHIAFYASCSNFSLFFSFDFE